MTTEVVVKLGMTVFVVAIGIALGFVNPHVRNVPRILQEDGWWLVCRADGTLVPHAKPLIWLSLVVFLILLWNG